MNDTMLNAALEYAERYSFSLLPAPPTGEKKPIEKAGSDFSAATDDAVELRRLWTKHPDANIIRRVYGTLTLDVESEEGHPEAAARARAEGKKFGIEALRELELENGQLPKTFLCGTWSGGLHVTYNAPQGFEDMKFKSELAPGVELRSKGIVMMPPSVRGGKSYRVIDDATVADLPEKWIEFCTKEQPSPDDWEQVRPRGTGPTLCEKYGIGMLDVLVLPPNAKRVEDGYIIKHPIHGATGDGNMFVNTRLDLWCCYHAGCDNSGGDPITWVAVREGFIECREAHGGLDTETFLKCKDVLRTDGLIPEDIADSGNASNGEGKEKEEPKKEPDAEPLKWYDGDMTSVSILVNGKPVLKKLPPIPEIVIVEGPTTIEALLPVFHEHLYIEEDYNVTGPICGFLSNFTPQDTIILGIVGPSGSIKTEMIRSFGEVQNQYCYPLSSLTEHTLASGLEKNLDTIPLLRGRVLTIKDLTTLLSKKEDVRSAVFAQFRDTSDGYVHLEFGNGVKKEFHDIHSAILFAATPAIERYYSMYADLGTRMIFMRPQNDPVKARKKSEENQRRGIKGVRRKLQDAMLSFIDTQVKRLLSGEPLPDIPDEIADEIGEYCDLLAWLRHPIIHDYRGGIDERPDPEFPTRLVNAITLLTRIHAFVYRREVADENDLNFARRVVTDNVPTMRAALLKHISDDWISTPKLSEKSGLTVWKTRYHLDELVALTVCEKKVAETVKQEEADGFGDGKDKRPNYYRVSPEWSSTIKKYEVDIRIGGRIKKNIKSNDGKDGLDEEIGTPSPNSNLLFFPSDRSQSEIVNIVEDTFELARGNETPKSRKAFVNFNLAAIRRNFPDLISYPLEELIEKLCNENRSKIQKILAERTDAA
jgi:hypothetical protein